LRWLEDKVHREGVSIGVRGGIDASPGGAKEVYDGREGKAERNAKNGREEEDFGDFEVRRRREIQCPVVERQRMTADLMACLDKTLVSVVARH
jgi:hypothetical protein